MPRMTAPRCDAVPHVKLVPQPHPRFHGVASSACALASASVNSLSAHALSIGKYTLSPMSKLTETGLYAASVSVRSGRGSGTLDRVFRFVSAFPPREAAIQYALEQGRSVIRQTRTT